MMIDNDDESDGSPKGVDDGRMQWMKALRRKVWSVNGEEDDSEVLIWSVELERIKGELGLTQNYRRNILNYRQIFCL